MTDLVEHIRRLLDHHRIDDQGNEADVGVVVAQHLCRIIPDTWLNRSLIAWACARRRSAPRSAM
jgi:hypothetical protein